jgi:GalNAc5-diNAcBac-PP-undecaprenol beta-1,3-glucosyltransferase
MQGKPLVSVIMVTYNRSNVLEKSINKLLKQTYSKFELLVIDGSSTDNTSEVVKAFKDRRIRYFCQKKNEGILSGRNMGLDMARGDYICFLDDDDELISEALSTAVKEFKKNYKKEAKGICFGCIDPKTGKMFGYGLKNGERIRYKYALCENIKFELWGILDKEVIRNARFNEKLWGAEGNLWLKILRKFNIIYIEKPLRIYHRDHGGNVCKFENQLKKADKFVLNNLAFLEEFGEEQKRLCPKAYARRLSVLGFWQIMAGDKKEGRSALKKSLKIKLAPKPLILYFASAFIGKEKLARIYSKIASSKILGKISG